MGKNRRGIQLTLLAFTSVLLGVIVLWLILNNTTPKPPSLINITRNEYEKAYDRWRQREIVEYRITTRQVTSSTDCLTRATILEEVTNMTGSAECAHKSGYFTVESLFDAINTRLDAAQSPSDADMATTWSVDLDPELGYPRSLNVELATAASTPNTVLTGTTTVENIEILKVGPITPSRP